MTTCCPLGQALEGTDRPAPPLPLATALAVDQPRPRQRNRQPAEGADKQSRAVAVAIGLGSSLALLPATPAERARQVRLHHRLDETANRQAARFLERIEPIVTGNNRHRKTESSPRML